MAKTNIEKNTVVFKYNGNVRFYLMQDKKTWTNRLNNCGKFAQTEAAMFQMKNMEPCGIQTGGFNDPQLIEQLIEETGMEYDEIEEFLSLPRIEGGR